MERKVRKKKQLKWRILQATTIILSVSMFVSTGVSYIYFQKNSREKVLFEKKAGLEYASGQMEYMLEDIQNFARSIIVDENLQNALERKSEDNVMKKEKKNAIIMKRLAFYNGLRLFIGGSFLTTADGRWYSSVSVHQTTDYLNTKKETPQLIEYFEHPEQVFSDPYYGIDTWSSLQLICYRTNMMDKYHFGQLQGTLYLEINMDYFLNQIRRYEKENNNVCLLGNAGKVLYESNKGEIEEILQRMPEYQSEGVHHVKEGYLICDAIEGSGWKICTLLTNSYLWAESSYVLKFFFASFVFSLAAILFFLARKLEKVVQPIRILSERMESIRYEELEEQKSICTGDEIQTLYECYNDMVREIQKGIEQRMEFQLQRQEMEFDIMLSQINPHYLYNVLNTVVYLSAAGKNKEVTEVTVSLIASLQETLKIGEKNIETTVKKELELTDCYINIQKYRYPNLFEVEVKCDSECMDCIVPKTIIQPLVENAILHGILPMERKGKIEIVIKKENGCLFIVVTDDGEGISQDKINLFEQGETFAYDQGERKHIGISNIRDRIRYLYGEAYGMSIERRDESGTKVELKIPGTESVISRKYKI